MSNYIVLVKQVPDVSQITDNAFDPQSGTLIRSRLSNVINDLDAQALAFAHQMKLQSGNVGKVVCLTMGPPMSEEVLRYSLSRSADAAVLLTDRALGGADTVATANPLAFAAKKIVKDIFNGDKDYYIVSGMQSVDGDTAQVPPQMAEELDISCVAYATDSEFKNGRFEFTRIISGGSQVVAVKHTPAIVTVAKYEYPLFASFAATRKANKFEIFSWTNADINATQIGAQGSKTRVIRVFPPGKSTRKAQQMTDVVSLAEKIKADFAGAESQKQGVSGDSNGYILPAKRTDKFDRSFEGTQKESDDFRLLAEKLRSLGVKDASGITEEVKEKILADESITFHTKALDDMVAGLKLTKPAYSGQVWVIAEHSNGKIHPAAFELIGKATDLAKSLDTEVGVVLAGCKVESMAKELITGGADNVYVVEDPLLEEFDPRSYRKVVADVIKKYSPQIVLFAATPQGRMLAPLVSYRIGCGLTADCTSLNINDSSRKEQVAVLLQTRPALGGNIMATICTKDSTCQMATARPGVMKRLDNDMSRKGKVIKHQVVLTKDDISLDVIATEMGAGKVSFDSDVIVAGGKGMQSRDNYDRLVGSLCDALSQTLEVTVEKGASRAAVEQGWIDRVYQVGQTGTAVGPKLYVALGISGAIQHMIGVANTETIVAINSDPNAPVFKQCDYYIVGSVEEVVPQLVNALKG